MVFKPSIKAQDRKNGGKEGREEGWKGERDREKENSLCGGVRGGKKMWPEYKRNFPIHGLQGHISVCLHSFLFWGVRVPLESSRKIQIFFQNKIHLPI